MKSSATYPATSQVRLLASPSRFELTVLYFLLGAHIVLASDAAIPSGWVSFTVVSFFAVALWFVVRIGFIAWRFRTTQRNLSRWLEAAVVFAVLVIIHTTPVGVMARVYLSEGKLLEEVLLAQEREENWRGSSGIPCGLFTVQAAVSDTNGTVWLETVSGTRIFESKPGMWGGVLYCTQEQPAAFGEISYRHLYGHWWVWLQDI